MCVDISGLLEVFPSADVVVVGREERGLLVLRREAGTFAFNQVPDEAVVAAVPLQGGPASPLEEPWLSRLLQVEQAVAGLVVGLGRYRGVLREHASDDLSELERDALGAPDVLGRGQLNIVVVVGWKMGVITDICSRRIGSGVRCHPFPLLGVDVCFPDLG